MVKIFGFLDVSSPLLLAALRSSTLVLFYLELVAASLVDDLVHIEMVESLGVNGSSFSVMTSLFLVLRS